MLFQNLPLVSLLMHMTSATTASPTVYLIRHGEKPKSGDGLTKAGKQRAQCLVNVFAANSTYNIGYIIAEQPESGKPSLNLPKGPYRPRPQAQSPLSQSQSILVSSNAETASKDGKEQRPYDTVLPLATSLNQTIDTSCTKTDAKCVADLVEAYTGERNVLICWEHGELTDIVEALGDSNAPEYSDDSFNIIWTDPSPYTAITAMTSENCPGLDD